MPPALRQQKRPSRTGGLSRRDRERLDPCCKAAVQERLAEWAFERGVQARQMRQEAGKHAAPERVANEFRGRHHLLRALRARHGAR